MKFEFTVQPDGSGPGEASTVQKITCRALRGEGVKATFLGTVRVRTDHPHKPEITFKYLGFFDAPEAVVPPRPRSGGEAVPPGSTSGGERGERKR